MVCYSVLRIVVGADSFRTVARTDLILPVFRPLGLLLRFFHIVEAAPQYAHCLCLVFNLALFVLTDNDQPSRNMGNTHGGVGCVDALTAGASCAHNIDAQVFLFDNDFRFLSFG